MKNRTIIWWVITFILLNIFLFLHFIAIEEINERTGSIVFLVNKLFVDFVIVFGVAFILTVLAAAFPYRNLNYWRKLKAEFPIVSSLFLLLLVVVFGYEAYYENFRGVKLLPPEVFEKLTAPDNLDCSSIKKGSFIIADDVIVRQDSLQFETKVRSKIKTVYKITWTDNCEYILTSQKDTTKVFRYKVMEVTEDGYTCYSLSNTGRSTIRYQVKKIKPGR